MAIIDFPEFVRSHIKDYLAEHVYTSIPARVTGVEEIGNSVYLSVQPTIDRIYSSGVRQSLPELREVPVMFPSSGGGILSFPITVGDTVLLIFSMRSIDEWDASDGTSFTAPTDGRNFSLSDAIAIPGLATQQNGLNPNRTDVEMRFNSLFMRLEAAGDIVLGNEGHTLTLKEDGTVEHSNGAKITPDGDFIDSSGISLRLHKHPQEADSDGDTQVDTGAPK